MIYGDTEQSYRKTADLINRIRHQECGGTPYRTLQDNTEKEGAAIIDYFEKKSKRILKENGFSEDGIYNGNNPVYASGQPATICDQIVYEAALGCIDDAAIMDAMNNPVCYEDPAQTVIISIDDVVVKRQEEIRQKDGRVEESKLKYVHNTIAHVAKEGKCYTINGHDTRAVLCYLIAFIFNNNLTNNRFQFFTDGHKILDEMILKCFSWYSNIGIILDWYHLEKKCKEKLSMAMKGSVVRNNFLDQLLPLLWAGLVDKAIELLSNLSSSEVRNQTEVNSLIEYLKRNKNHIPCYAVRKQLGLRNSSNIGEKMNDLVVSERQKHSGMSWSRQGSVALASVTAIKRNQEFKTWFNKRELEFKLAA